MSLTINDTAARVQYTATGGQTSFTVPFEFFANSDLKVYRNGVLSTYAASPTLVTQYRVTGAGVAGGGSIVLGAGATVGDAITIVRDVPVARSTDFPTSGPFQIDALNTELSKLTAMIQQIETVLEKRVIKLSDFDQPNTLSALPDKAARAGCLLGFNATTGDLEVGPLVTAVESLSAAIANINAVAASIANVNTAAGSISNINAVAAQISGIASVVANLSEILAADDNAAAASASAAAASTHATTASNASASASASSAAAAASANSAVNAPGTSATSTTSLAVGTGSKSLTITTGKAFAKGQFVTITSNASPANWMHGSIYSHDSGTGALTVQVGTVGGTGTIADWTIALSGPSAGGSDLPLAGGTMTGKVTLAASASGGAGINFGAGVDPTTPVNGDVWTTTTALKARLNGTTSTVALVGDLASYQPLDATLTALAGVTTAANKLIYATGVDAFATTDLSAFARTLLDDASQGAAQTTLGLAIGSNVQAYSSELAAIAGLATNSYGRALLTLAASSNLLSEIITASSLTFPNGFIKLSSGLYFMWGSFTAGTTNTTFNYATINGSIALTTGSIAVGSGGLDRSVNLQENPPRITGCTTTGFTVSNDESSSSTFHFMAVGL